MKRNGGTTVKFTNCNIKSILAEPSTKLLDGSLLTGAATIEAVLSLTEENAESLLELAYSNGKGYIVTIEKP
ncbi:MAG: hypothetical protein ACXABY_07575 [Candidatus Thorarchaeota archaeon]|jgi:hypothetical protein